MSNGINRHEDWEIPDNVKTVLSLLISHYELTSDEFDNVSNEEIVYALKAAWNLLDRLEFLEFNYGDE